MGTKSIVQPVTASASYSASDHVYPSGSTISKLPWKMTYACASALHHPACLPIRRAIPTHRQCQYLLGGTENRAEGKHGAAFDQRFLLLDSMTSIPLARQAYRLKHGDTIVEGVTDDDGYTMPIPTGDGSATVEWTILGDDNRG